MVFFVLHPVLPTLTHVLHLSIGVHVYGTLMVLTPEYTTMHHEHQRDKRLKIMAQPILPRNMIIQKPNKAFRDALSDTAV